MTAQEGEGWGGVSILHNTFKISVNIIEFKPETQIYFMIDFLMPNSVQSSPWCVRIRGAS